MKLQNKQNRVKPSLNEEEEKLEVTCYWGTPDEVYYENNLTYGEKLLDYDTYGYTFGIWGGQLVCGNDNDETSSLCHDDLIQYHIRKYGWGDILPIEQVNPEAWSWYSLTVTDVDYEDDDEYPEYHDEETGEVLPEYKKTYAELILGLGEPTARGRILYDFDNDKAFIAFWSQPTKEEAQRIAKAYGKMASNAYMVTFTNKEDAEHYFQSHAPFTYSEWLNGNTNKQTIQTDNEKYINHLASAKDKWQQTQSWRDEVAKKNADKLGNMTMAQYHNMIYQEKKKGKPIMKEQKTRYLYEKDETVMKQYNKYVRKWQDLCIAMNEAMQKDDFSKADNLLKEATEAYNKYKECSSYPSSNREMSFGELNYMLECELPRLFKQDKKALKECVNFIKSDTNLCNQFRFMDALRNYNCEGNNARNYVTESLELACEGINRKTLRKSLNGFADLLAKHEIGGYKLDEDTKKYFKDCEKIIAEQKRITNLTEYTNCINSIASYIEEHKSPIVESMHSVGTMTEDLENKIAHLNEEEQSLVKDIIDAKQPMVEMRQEKIFNKFKNECLHNVNTLIANSTNNDDIQGLKAIKERVESKIFCKETIVQDIAQLLEVKDILEEK